MKELIQYSKPETVAVQLDNSGFICASGDKSGGNGDIPFNDINW